MQPTALRVTSLWLCHPGTSSSSLDLGYSPQTLPSGPFPSFTQGIPAEKEGVTLFGNDVFKPGPTRNGGSSEAQAQPEWYPRSRLRFGRVEEGRTRPSSPVRPSTFPSLWGGVGLRQGAYPGTCALSGLSYPQQRSQRSTSPGLLHLGFAELQDSPPYFLSSLGPSNVSAAHRFIEWMYWKAYL